MEEPTMRPPPLPPKSRRPPPIPSSSSTSTTVLTNCIIQDDYNQSGISFTNSSSNDTKTHVVKIQINPSSQDTTTFINSHNNNHTFNNNNSSSSANSTTTNVTCVVQPCIKISVNTSSSSGELDEMMVQNNHTVKNMVDSSTETNGYFYYDHLISSGQVSPSDTLDSGTCSDLDGTPTPPTKMGSTSGISVTIIGEQTKQQLHLSSLNSNSSNEIDSDDNESSCSRNNIYFGPSPPLIFSKNLGDDSSFPQTLLQDIRNVKLTEVVNAESSVSPILVNDNNASAVVISSSSSSNDRDDDEEIVKSEYEKKGFYETDMYYDFHLNEHDFTDKNVPEDVKTNVETDETFAGYKDLLCDGSSTIRSAKGTVRGVKNRVRAGIATFLQISSNVKNYKEKEAGKVVVYTTTMGIIRETYQACMKVKQILRTLLVKFEERDVFMSGEYQEEIKERMKCDYILIPQVFVDGQHVGDADTIEKLNESGELRRIMKPFKSLDACSTCKVCGGYRLLPCTVCNGSKKSVHRNHFTTEFVALKCMNCDEVGLVKCTEC